MSLTGKSGDDVAFHIEPATETDAGSVVVKRGLSKAQWHSLTKILDVNQDNSADKQQAAWLVYQMAGQDAPKWLQAKASTGNWRGPRVDRFGLFGVLAKSGGPTQAMTLQLADDDAMRKVMEPLWAAAESVEEMGGSWPLARKRKPAVAMLGTPKRPINLVAAAMPSPRKTQPVSPAAVPSPPKAKRVRPDQDDAKDVIRRVQAVRKFARDNGIGSVGVTLTGEDFAVAEQAMAQMNGRG